MSLAAACVCACGVTHVTDGGVDGGTDAGIDAGRDAGDDPRCLERTALADYDAFQERFALALCENEMACGEARRDWARAEDCAEHDPDVRWLVDRGPRRQVAEGLAAIDPALVEECFADLRRCGWPSPRWQERLDDLHYARRLTGRSACARVVRPRCPAPDVGEPCLPLTEPERCGDGLFCDRMTNSCNPTCRARGGEGAPCNHSAWACADRDDGALVWCDDDSLFIDELGACRGVHEQAPVGVDERCGLVDTPDGPRLATCEAPFECEPDFSDPPDREYRCAARPTIGQGCGLTCGPGLFCLDRICVELRGDHRPTAVGEPCDGTGPCDRQYRTACVEGVCRSVGSHGEPCAPSRRTRDLYPLRRCDPGLVCAPETRRCVGAIPRGSTCVHSWQCWSGCCAEGRCVDGGPCRTDCADP